MLNNHRRPGIVTDIDSAGLVALARRHHCCLGIVPYVGDFVPLRAPLARVWFDPGHSGMPTPEQLGITLPLAASARWARTPPSAFASWLT